MFKKTLVTVMAVALAVILSVSAFADFTPSVAAKDAPDVAAATIWSGNTEIGSIPAGELVIVSYAGKDSASAAAKTALEDAYKDLNEKALDVLAPEVMDVAKKYSTSIKASDLIVRDLVDVNVSGSTADALAGSNGKIKLRFNLNLTNGALLVVMHKTSAKWVVVDEVEINSDGSVTVELDSTSPLAFITTTASPNPPATGDMPLWATILMASVGICGAAVIVIVVISKKRAVA